MNSFSSQLTHLGRFRDVRVLSSRARDAHRRTGPSQRGRVAPHAAPAAVTSRLEPPRPPCSSSACCTLAVSSRSIGPIRTQRAVPAARDCADRPDRTLAAHALARKRRECSSETRHAITAGIPAADCASGALLARRGISGRVCAGYAVPALDRAGPGIGPHQARHARPIRLECARRAGAAPWIRVPQFRAHCSVGAWLAILHRPLPAGIQKGVDWTGRACARVGQRVPPQIAYRARARLIQGVRPVSTRLAGRSPGRRESAGAAHVAARVSFQHRRVGPGCARHAIRVGRVGARDASWEGLVLASNASQTRPSRFAESAWQTAAILGPPRKWRAERPFGACRLDPPVAEMRGVTRNAL